MALTSGAGMVPPPPTNTRTVDGRGSPMTSTSRGTSAVSRRPASRTTITRRSTRNGGVRQASTTAPTLSSSPAPPPISSTMSAWSPSPTTSSSSPRTAWATSAASSPLTRYTEAGAPLTASFSLGLADGGEHVTGPAGALDIVHTHNAAAPGDAEGRRADGSLAPLGELQIQDLAQKRLVGGRQEERVAQRGQRRR